MLFTFIFVCVILNYSKGFYIANRSEFNEKGDKYVIVCIKSYRGRN